ncbi:hypothetical protein AVEN_28889-1 [Araneus ventricosus]|uniref:Uncharacterized protein n=1 Tax=Araneus ventricosus TaxID=182803 RepID=A0A4Y2AKT2_ARAVE|nr:hypothetical protein AVEN_28889-1 [Araneus ventricosus]
MQQLNADPRKFQHKSIRSRITRSCDSRLDFHTKFNFMVDLEKARDLRGGEEIPLFSASQEDSVMCSVLAKEKILIITQGSAECLIQEVPEASWEIQIRRTDFLASFPKGVLRRPPLYDLKKDHPVREF